MAGEYSYLIRHCNFIVIVLAIIFQSARVQTRKIPIWITDMQNDLTLMSWEDDFPVEAPMVHTRCQNASTCEKVTNYPMKLAKMIMDRLSLKNVTKFANDQLNIAKYDEDLGEMTDLCETKNERITFPRAAKDLNNDWHFILNIPKHQFQSFRIHECLNVSKASCHSATYVSREKYALKCEQKFTQRKMVYLNLETKTVATGNFFTPSCCSCYLNKSG